MGSQFVIQLVDDDEGSGAAGGIYKTLGQSYSIKMSQQQILQNVNSSKQFKDLDNLVFFLRFWITYHVLFLCILLHWSEALTLSGLGPARVWGRIIVHQIPVKGDHCVV